MSGVVLGRLEVVMPVSSSCEVFTIDMVVHFFCRARLREHLCKGEAG